MPHSCPGNDLSIEELVSALVHNVQVSDSNSPAKSELLKLGPQKIFTIERSLSDALQVIRAIRNTYIPVNKLPPELLSRILEHRYYERDLVAATHVCQYWRSTLISSPTLWTDVQFGFGTSADRANTYLERSKSTIIDIRMYISSPIGQEPEVPEQFASHIPRTRSLFIQGSLGVQATTSLLLCTPTPYLESLQIHAREGPVRNLDNFLGQQAPLLNSVTFDGVFPILDSPFTLPSLTTLNLYLTEDAGPLRISSLLRFFAECPQLQEIFMSLSSETIQDVTSDGSVSLESLVKLDYTCYAVCRLLPCLKLPRLERLNVASLVQAEQVHKLADLLPYGSQTLLSKTTKMSYFSDDYTQKTHLFGEGSDVSITGMRIGGNSATIGLFSSQSCIPFGRIEDLTVEGDRVTADFSFDLFGNLEIFRMSLWEPEFAEGYMRLLHPDPVAGIPCPSLREVRCNSWFNLRPFIQPLITLAREREVAGHKLKLVCVSGAQELGEGLEEELKGHVGELRIGFVDD